MSNEQTKKRWRMSRRSFLIGAGIASGSLALGIGFGVPQLRLAAADLLDGAAIPASFPNDPAIWFEVQANGRIKLFTPKVEMGQGIHTAIAQIAAEELEVEPSMFDMVQGGTNLGPRDTAGTSASGSVMAVFTPLREVAATLREMLRGEAARRLAVNPNDLVVNNGVFSLRDNPSRTISYGAIVAEPVAWEVPETPPALKPISQFRVIGQPTPRTDIPAKLKGEAVYGFDARAEGMQFGAVIRPPTIGAKLRRVSEGTARSVPGVTHVVIDGDFAGVVATTRIAAWQGVAALAVEWDEGKLWQQEEIDALLDVDAYDSVPIQRIGNAPQALNQAGNVVIGDYRTPLAAHAHLEAQAALVSVGADKVEVWSSTQAALLVQGEVARALGRPVEQVVVTPTFLGGGFGRKLDGGAAVEAARLAAVAGVPVHVGWNRSEDFRNGYLRPPTHSTFRASLSPEGKITAFEHRQASGDVLFAFFPAAMQALLGADFGAWRGGRLFYESPNILTTAARIAMPLPTGSWRGLGLLANVFAVESFIDELAVAAGQDGLTFRLNNLPTDEFGQRMAAVLRRAAEVAGWGQPLPPGRAHGIACSVDVNTCVAQVAEVSREGDQIRVHKIVAAVDPGLVINPDGARAQTEGGITQALSATLLEKITIKDGRIEAGNFDRYPLLTMAETPEIVVELLSSGEQPYGMGEPPMGPTAAVVANAVYALTGQRLRELPLTLGA